MGMEAGLVVEGAGLPAVGAEQAVAVAEAEELMRVKR